MGRQGVNDPHLLLRLEQHVLDQQSSRQGNLLVLINGHNLQENGRDGESSRERESREREKKRADASR